MKININDKIKDLVEEHPSLINILAKLGFSEILKPGKINTVGRFVSLKSGISLRKLDFKDIEEKLKNEGYELIDE